MEVAVAAIPWKLLPPVVLLAEVSCRFLQCCYFRAKSDLELVAGGVGLDASVALGPIDLVVVLDAGTDREADEDNADQAGDPLRDVEVDGEDHACGEDADGPVGTVLQVAVLGQRVGADQVDRHRTHEQRADAETDGDQDDHVGHGEGAGDSVEGERRVLDLQVHEGREGRCTGLEGLGCVALQGELGGVVVLVVLLVLVALEEGVQGSDDDVQHDRGHAPGEDPGFLVLRGRGGHEPDEQQGDAGGDHVELAGLGQLTLERQPGDLPLLEDEGEEDHEQERAAEDGDVRVCDLEPLGVLVWLEEGQVPDVRGAHVGREHHDDDREDHAHADHGDEDADGHEQRLPELRHVLEDPGVDDRVVEREGDLDDDEDHQLEHRQHVVVPEHAGDGQQRDTEVVLVVLQELFHRGSFRKPKADRLGCAYH